jgi:polyhydroxybutyrate depolymerase
MGNALISGELTVGGRERTFALQLPPAGPGDGHVPLVLVLHGNHPAATGRMMHEWTTFDAHADARGWAVAYPDGWSGCWADGRGVTTADEAGVDDVGFLSAVIDWSADRHGTVPDRVVVAGVSNGAFMAHRLALEASDRVAVLATVAGGMPAALHDVTPPYAVSALLIHGTADQMSPIEGGFSRHLGPNGELRGRTLSLRETAERWRVIDRCPPGPGEAHTTDIGSRTTSGPGVGDTRVAAWTLSDVGHTWPGPPAVPDFDAADEICRFAQPLLTHAAARRR